ncbi:hypothetical protein LG331_06565 [Vreelandella aquamarina]|uniref:hypothetical protein n=1 Tax=Vreelandella aquamarina TaxID=77097 RepID=UPI00384F8C43
MSDHHIVFIPADPHYLPTEQQVSSAKAALWQWMPEAEAIEAAVAEYVQFHDCGSNFEYVRCHVCGQELTIPQWHLLMEQDYDLERGFGLTPQTLPCCGSVASVNQLVYSFVQGFSRFSLTAINPRTGAVSAQQTELLQRQLGHPLLVIYCHL